MLLLFLQKLEQKIFNKIYIFGLFGTEIIFSLNKHCLESLQLLLERSNLKSLPLTVKLFKGSSKPCSGLLLNPMRAPLSNKIKYLGRQFLICSPKTTISCFRMENKIYIYNNYLKIIKLFII